MVFREIEPEASAIRKERDELPFHEFLHNQLERSIGPNFQVFRSSNIQSGQVKAVDYRVEAKGENKQENWDRLRDNQLYAATLQELLLHNKEFDEEVIQLKEKRPEGFLEVDLHPDVGEQLSQEVIAEREQELIETFAQDLKEVRAQQPLTTEEAEQLTEQVEDKISRIVEEGPTQEHEQGPRHTR
jgi:hypothetical protein